MLEPIPMHQALPKTELVWQPPTSPLTICEDLTKWIESLFVYLSERDPCSPAVSVLKALKNSGTLSNIFQLIVQEAIKLEATTFFQFIEILSFLHNKQQELAIQKLKALIYSNNLDNPTEIFLAFLLEKKLGMSFDWNPLETLINLSSEENCFGFEGIYAILASPKNPDAWSFSLAYYQKMLAEEENEWIIEDLLSQYILVNLFIGNTEQAEKDLKQLLTTGAIEFYLPLHFAFQWLKNLETATF